MQHYIMFCRVLPCQSVSSVDMSSNVQGEERENMVTGEEKKGRRRTGLSQDTDYYDAGACDEAPGICSHILIICSMLLVIITLPFSLCLVIKVVQVKQDILVHRIICFMHEKNFIPLLTNIFDKFR